MNLYLHDTLDRHRRKRHPGVPLLRYMDDLLVLCDPDDDVSHLYDDLRELVEEAKLQLKIGKKQSVHHLQRQAVEWLGFYISRGTDGVEVRLPYGSQQKDARKWREYFRARFIALHSNSEAPAAANSLIKGFVSWAGPAFQDSDTRALYDFLRKAARSAAFEEILSYQVFRREWKSAHDRWLGLRGRVSELENRPARIAATVSAASPETAAPF